jgi:hypothetical protein
VGFQHTWVIEVGSIGFWEEVDVGFHLTEFLPDLCYSLPESLCRPFNEGTGGTDNQREAIQHFHPPMIHAFWDRGQSRTEVIGLGHGIS